MILLISGEFTKVVNSYYSYGDTDSIEDAIEIASDKGYMKNVNPEETISREEACAIFCKLTNTDISSDEVSFIDTFEISTWAVPYVSAMVNSEIIIGYPDNSFKPQKLLTKAEFIIMLSRINGVGGADDEDEIELIFDDLENIEVGIIEFSGDTASVYPVMESINLESGDKIILTLSKPVNVEDEDIVIDGYDSTLIDFDEDFNLLSAKAKGDTTITFRTKDNTYVKNIKIYIY